MISRCRKIISVYLVLTLLFVSILPTSALANEVDNEVNVASEETVIETVTNQASLASAVENNVNVASEETVIETVTNQGSLASTVENNVNVASEETVIKTVINQGSLASTVENNVNVASGESVIVSTHAAVNSIAESKENVDFSELEKLVTGPVSYSEAFLTDSYTGKDSNIDGLLRPDGIVERLPQTIKYTDTNGDKFDLPITWNRIRDLYDNHGIAGYSHSKGINYEFSIDDSVLETKKVSEEVKNQIETFCNNNKVFVNLIPSVRIGNGFSPIKLIGKDAWVDSGNNITFIFPENANFSTLHYGIDSPKNINKNTEGAINNNDGTYSYIVTPDMGSNYANVDAGNFIYTIMDPKLDSKVFDKYLMNKDSNGDLTVTLEFIGSDEISKSVGSIELDKAIIVNNKYDDVTKNLTSSIQYTYKTCEHTEEEKSASDHMNTCDSVFKLALPSYMTNLKLTDKDGNDVRLGSGHYERINLQQDIPEILSGKSVEIYKYTLPGGNYKLSAPNLRKSELFLGYHTEIKDDYVLVYPIIVSDLDNDGRADIYETKVKFKLGSVTLTEDQNLILELDGGTGVTYHKYENVLKDPTKENHIFYGYDFKYNENHDAIVTAKYVEGKTLNQVSDTGDSIIEYNQYNDGKDTIKTTLNLGQYDKIQLVLDEGYDWTDVSYKPVGKFKFEYPTDLLEGELDRFNKNSSGKGIKIYDDNEIKYISTPLNPVLEKNTYFAFDEVTHTLFTPTVIQYNHDSTRAPRLSTAVEYWEDSMFTSIHETIRNGSSTGKYWVSTGDYIKGTVNAFDTKIVEYAGKLRENNVYLYWTNENMVDSKISLQDYYHFVHNQFAGWPTPTEWETYHYKVNSSISNLDDIEAKKFLGWEFISDENNVITLKARYNIDSKPEPTVKPTVKPTVVPTLIPTVIPTIEPTVEPTIEPTIEPTVEPTIVPTVAPTVVPTVTPTLVPTVAPTVKPSVTPTVKPELEKNKVEVDYEKGIVIIDPEYLKTLPDGEYEHDGHVIIIENGTPRIGGKIPGWSLISLLLTLVTVLIAIYYLVNNKKEYLYTLKNQEYIKDNEGTYIYDKDLDTYRLAKDEDLKNMDTRKNEKFTKNLIAIIFALINVIIFVMFNDLTTPMILIKECTLYIFIVLLVQVLSLGLIYFKKRKVEVNNN